MSELVLGIDLGTTNSAVGVVDSGFPVLLADSDGHRITPSAVWIGRDSSIEVGTKALRRRALEPDRVVTSIKRLIGRRVAEIDESFPHPIEKSSADEPLVLGKTPVEISAEILKELKRLAEWRMETTIAKAVITVPAYFHDAQRADTKRAAELAGLEVLRILNEPTAAALAYGLDKLGERSRVAVYDLGGGTFDLSILEMQEGVFQVLATHGDTRLGGDDLDALIIDHVLHKHGLSEVSSIQRMRLMEEAERVKCQLSAGDIATFRLPFFDDDRSIELPITRADLESIAAAWIARSIRCCAKALADAQLDSANLDAVILVGGSTRMPAVRDAVEKFFGKKPDISQHPDEAIALGATIQGGILSGALGKMVLLDVTPLSLGIETLGGLMNVLIPRNTTIPCKAGEAFTNAADGQSGMKLRVLQGEREMANDNWELGNFNINFQSAPKGQARVGVQFKIDENGILEVLARDIATGTDTIVTLGKTAVDVDDAAVEAMVGESVEHAFEDMALRVFTEARLKAEELIPAVESALQQGLVNEAEKSEITIALDAVRAAIKSAAGNPLKAAVQRLDAATEAMAARIVEDAMTKALDRQMGETKNPLA
ncbi:MAG: molecular chaperone DnaK [Verrucomicrobiia bacterium Tous-C5FEB]|nr:MAG: molecular chaperone DnaK [Verrucomicrobiae bacterium Tous-C5FEB]